MSTHRTRRREKYLHIFMGAYIVTLIVIVVAMVLFISLQQGVIR